LGKQSKKDRENLKENITTEDSLNAEIIQFINPFKLNTKQQYKTTIQTK
jgi:hypothetical protein